MIKKQILISFIIGMILALPTIFALPAPTFAHPNNITTPLQSVGYIIGLTDPNGSGAMFGTVVYFLMVAVLFMGMKSFTNERALVVALFISSIIGILLRIFSWVNDYVIYLSLMLLIYSLFQLWRKND